MAILGYCPGKVGFGGIREPARRKLRNCVQISMPCGFKAERLCGAAVWRAPKRRAFCAVRVTGGEFPKGPGRIPSKTRQSWDGPAVVVGGILRPCFVDCLGS